MLIPNCQTNACARYKKVGGLDKCQTAATQIAPNAILMSSQSSERSFLDICACFCRGEMFQNLMHGVSGDSSGRHERIQDTESGIHVQGGMSLPAGCTYRTCMTSSQQESTAKSRVAIVCITSIDTSAYHVVSNEGSPLYLPTSYSPVTRRIALHNLTRRQLAI